MTKRGENKNRQVSLQSSQVAEATPRVGTDFKFEVAFSFMSADEPVAQNLCDLLQDRYPVFLYSKRQGELAGRDGELRFNEIFGQESRIVVVLYRNGWGSTPWTRVTWVADTRDLYRLIEKRVG